MTTIRVISVRGVPARKLGITYCGRACAGWEASALGNPYSQHGREEDIRLFKKDLWACLKAGLAGSSMTTWQAAAWTAMLVLVDKRRSGDNIVLGCWCNPLACHCDVIAAAIVWLDEQMMAGSVDWMWIEHIRDNIDMRLVRACAPKYAAAPVGMHMLAVSATEF